MKRVMLIVLDGWGINPDKEGNAILLASTPNIARLADGYPKTELLSAGNSVGLPHGQMGNSEVGHLTIGAGRVVFQELTRINKAIDNAEFQENQALNGLFSAIKAKDGALHLMGLVSDGGVHSHINHLYEIIETAKKRGLKKHIYIHAFTDGRDTPAQSAKIYMEEIVLKLKRIGVGRVVTVSGRYYAMDRDNRWDRVKKAYDAIANGRGIEEEDPINAILNAYAEGQSDEFIVPRVIKDPVKVNDGDGMIFFNLRSDRARQLTRAFTERDFNLFERGILPRLSGFITMTEYDAMFGLPVMFPPQDLNNILAEVLSQRGVKQLRIAETEKYAHVTFFFNAGVETPLKGEERLLIPSVTSVPTYDKAPEMMAYEIGSKVLEKLKDEGLGFMLVNFANGDMVGHTGVLSSAIKACKVVDEVIGKVTHEAINKGWVVIITSDHGNCEQMLDSKTGEPHTAHTLNPVPFILIDEETKGVTLKQGMGLSSVAPTILKIMDIEIPSEMTSDALF